MDKTVRWYSGMLGSFAASLPAEARLRDIDAAAIRAALRFLHLVPHRLQEKMRMLSPLAGIGDQRRRMVPKRLRKVKSP